MEPIVSPWLIYLIYLTGPVSGILLFAGILYIVYGAVMFTISDERVHEYVKRYKSQLDEIEKMFMLTIGKIEKEESTTFARADIYKCINKVDELRDNALDCLQDLRKIGIHYKSTKKYLLFGVGMIIIGALIPSKETCYKMLVANYITPDNITTGVEISKETIEYILQKIAETAKAIK